MEPILEDLWPGHLVSNLGEEIGISMIEYYIYSSGNFLECRLGKAKNKYDYSYPRVIVLM